MNSHNTVSITAEAARRLAAHTASTALGGLHRRYQGFAQYPAYQERIHQAHDSFIGILPLVRQIIYYFLLGNFLIWTSVATYGLFYVVVMPASAASSQLFFDYSCSKASQSACIGDTGTNQCTFPCSPTASVDIFARHTSWEPLHPDVIPESISKTRILNPGKNYFLEVLLQLPESAVNTEAGIFSVRVDLTSKDGTVLARSHRSARIPHESGWISVVRKFLVLLPLILGALSETRTVLVASFRHYVESAAHPLRYIAVTLQSQGSLWRGNVPIEVVAGEVRIGKELNPFQMVLKEWFWLSFLVGTLVVLTSQVTFLALINHLWDVWREKQKKEEVDFGAEAYFFDSTPPQSTNDPFDEDDGLWETMTTEENARTRQSSKRSEEPVEGGTEQGLPPQTDGGP